MKIADLQAHSASHCDKLADIFSGKKFGVEGEKRRGPSIDP